MRRLHVLHAIGGGDTGGAMSHLLPLLSALERADCDVHLLCLGEGGLAEQARHRGLSVSVLPMASAWDPLVLVPLWRLLGGGPADLASFRVGEIAGDASGNPQARTDAMRPEVGAGHGGARRTGPARWDVVHSHGMRANLPVRLAVRGRRRKPCVFTTVHSDLELDYASSNLARLYRSLDRATLSSVDTVICVSDALRALLLERGYPARRMITVRSGIESSPGEIPLPASEMRPSASDTASPSGARAGRPRVGTVARLVPVKDIDLLLEVAALLRRTIPGLEVTVAGSGPEGPRLREEVVTRGLDGVVRFAGQVANISPILARTDVYLVTSVFEGGVSMSVLEAMAAGIPVVTTVAGGVAEAVKNGVTGFVVTRDQERGALAAALAERAAALLTDPQLRAQMGAAGARRVRELFLVERTAAATLGAYRRCLAARGDLM